MQRLLFVVCLVLATGCADEFQAEIAALKITHPPGHQLTSTEVRKVLRLARAVGIQRIESIGPFGAPHFQRGLRALGPETKTGRRVAQHELIIDDWRNIPAPYPEDGILNAQARSGQSSCARQWAEFTINGETKRIVCDHQTDLATADKVFAAIAAKNLEYVEEKAKQRNINFDQPFQIAVRPNEIVIVFGNPDRSLWTFVHGNLREAKFLIREAGELYACP